MDAYSPLQIVDSHEPDWRQTAIEVADTGRNFILICSEPAQLISLCDSLECQEYVPEQLSRWDVHALADVLEPGAYSKLLRRIKSPVYLVEQLYLRCNDPPRRQQLPVARPWPGSRCPPRG